MELTSRAFQYLCIVCFIVTSACLSITSSGTFEINTEVNFTCVHDPYTGSHRWRVDTAEVLICSFSTCFANLSNPTRFSFVSDPGNDVFVFTINPVSRLDDDSIIGCHNGSDEQTLKLEVKGKPYPTKKFLFHENEDNDEMSYVLWVPGFSRWSRRTFILKAEKIQDNYVPGYENDTKNPIASTTLFYGKPPNILNMECYQEFNIHAYNESGEMRMQTVGLEPRSRYRLTLCNTIMFLQSKAINLEFETHDKPSPPKEFKFNQNISSDTFPNVSWVPGNNGGCYQTFILQFEKQLPETGIETLNQAEENIHHQEITNTTAAELIKPKTLERHSKILDVESDKKFVIPSHNETTTICKQIKGLEPSSQYEIKLCGKNKYGESEVKTLLVKAHGKPYPPKKFNFNENINNDEMPYVTWEPGFNGGSDQTFILRFEKILFKTHNQTHTTRGKPTVYKENVHDQEITNTTAAEINKPKIDEGHAEILDVESNNIFAITSNNVTTTIRRQIKGIEPSSQYDIKLCAKNKYGESEVKTLNEITHGKPHPPKKFKFNENTNNDEMSYVSWEPGFNGGCDQTFILRFEQILIKTDNQTDTARGKPMSIKKIKFVEGHHEILDVKSNNTFAITSPKEAKEILLQIKGREPSSTYKIMLYSVNEYGESKVMTLYANETTILSHRSDHSDQQEQEMKVQLDGIVVEVADGASLRPGHTNQPKHDKTLQRHGLSVEESNGSDPLQPPI